MMSSTTIIAPQLVSKDRPHKIMDLIIITTITIIVVVLVMEGIIIKLRSNRCFSLIPGMLETVSLLIL